MIFQIFYHYNMIRKVGIIGQLQVKVNKKFTFLPLDKRGILCYNYYSKGVESYDKKDTHKNDD